MNCLGRSPNKGSSSRPSGGFERALSLCFLCIPWLPFHNSSNAACALTFEAFFVTIALKIDRCFCHCFISFPGISVILPFVSLDFLSLLQKCPGNVCHCSGSILDFLGFSLLATQISSELFVISPEMSSEFLLLHMLSWNFCDFPAGSCQAGKG